MNRHAEDIEPIGALQVAAAMRLAVTMDQAVAAQESQHPAAFLSQRSIPFLPMEP